MNEDKKYSTIARFRWVKLAYAKVAVSGVLSVNQLRKTLRGDFYAAKFNFVLGHFIVRSCGSDRPHPSAFNRFPFLDLNLSIQY
ncbi:MAG TPA: hypothetical protein V6C84_22360 [Coleofasciculaceae cyanobacterium]|jgi:hypothetical protein